ncbi:MAG TPA: hypothetical protein VNJ29_03215, partial [Candidatus Nitrosotenuis sp.]|nr:hypothetical protein [Candidatus Nitrosotenuis sp.]
DWKIVPLNDDDQPKITIEKNGQYIIVHKNDGKLRVYDCYLQQWLKGIRRRDEKIDLPMPWPDYERPKDNVPTSFKGQLNGEKGTFIMSTQDPIIGNFFNKKGEKKAIYAISPTFWSVFMNVKYFYDEAYRRVQLQILDKKC